MRSYSLVRNDGRLYIAGLIEPGRIDAATVRRSLRDFDGRGPIEVIIDSPGGNCAEGLAIYTLLREAAKPVHVTIYGVAESMAAVVAMAGSEVLIADTGSLLLHGAAVSEIGGRGTAAKLREIAERLHAYDALAADIFVRRTGLPRAEIERMIRAETRLDAFQAVEMGFADRVVPGRRAPVTERNYSEEPAQPSLRVVA